ncbi:YebC/PmpR family DNA-binding transcriptional regulator [Candidatus Magnetomonas plexicatena]|uniref:YebC/PmpR family DNA-binding transcriptional regulator n=1 Tax=Candidatus Magnetomonas plexicatena TaxID=2552947 RepID=UPI001C765884|nr:YebC/PmpR family DNA-binding transcriptional regulator [Nitrospirales bacterium LBB_01]
MSGHSKWSQIKRKKATTDSKRGKVFSKVVKEITVAARIGGGDPDGNVRLRTAIEKAKLYNMPYDNIKRAIQKGTGELPGAMYEEIMYEGYGIAGVALLIEAMTDNRNRTVAEIRRLLSKSGGNLGESGCVAWMFQKKGTITIDKKAATEDQLMTIALEAGAEDMKNEPEDEHYEIITTADSVEAVRTALINSGIAVSSSEITMIPDNYVSVDSATAEKLINLMDALDELDDVQNIYANFDLPEGFSPTDA